MVGELLMAEALALVAVRPESGRHATGNRSNLNAALAGLLVAELVVAGTVGEGRSAGEVVVSGPPPDHPLLAAAADVVADKGPKVKAVLAGMDHGLDRRLGHGTWDAVADSLAQRGILSPPSHGLRPSREVLDPAARDAALATLRDAAAGDEPLDIRTAAVLSMTGPAQLLEVIAPDRGARGHARRRIDTALDATQLRPVAEVVRRVIADTTSAAIVTSTTATPAT